MSEPKPQQEPSMEEILASIRRIISEDGQGAEETPEASPEEEILELTEEVMEEVPVEAEPEPEAERDPEPDPEPEPEPDFTPEIVAEEDPVEIETFDSAEASSPVAELDTNLISKGAARASEDKLSELAAAVSKESDDLSLGMNRTLEDLVKEIMRPMIKEWLDSNLPPLVERLVGREIDRLARRAEDK